jgi:hypothetical protein
MISFPQVSPPTLCAHPSLLPYVPHSPPICLRFVLKRLNFFSVAVAHSTEIVRYVIRRLHALVSGLSLYVHWLWHAVRNVLFCYTARQSLYCTVQFSVSFHNKKFLRWYRYIKNSLSGKTHHLLYIVWTTHSANQCQECTVLTRRLQSLENFAPIFTRGCVKWKPFGTCRKRGRHFYTPAAP